MTLTDNEAEAAFHQTKGLNKFEHASVHICAALSSASHDFGARTSTRKVSPESDRKMCVRAVNMARSLFDVIERESV